MSLVVDYAVLVIFGLVVSTVIYKTTQALGADDPFAIELIAWWLLTDLLILAELRGWRLRSSIEAVDQNPKQVLYCLSAVGVVLVLASVALTLREMKLPGKPYRVWPIAPGSGTSRRLTRELAARGLAGGYAAIHLAILLS